ncbi:hypothetical protein B0A49_11188, partial [Cryomyces minteri]
RVSFPLQGALLHASYQLRPRQKRGIGDNRISWIWRHGIDIERLSTGLEWKGKFWLCKACHEGGIKRQPLAAESSSNASKHMLKSHGIAPTGPPIQQPPTQSLDGWMKKDLPPEAKEEVFKRDLINWIAQADISFMQAASTELHKVIKSGGQYTESLLPSAGTARNWITTAFVQRRSQLKLKLHQARSKINLSFDIRSAPNDLDLLGLPRITGAHNGVNIARCVTAVIHEYQIEVKLGAFQMDNASNNDTTIQELADAITVTKTSTITGEGAIGKIHNVVKYINRNSSRIEAFMGIQLQLGVTKANLLKLTKDGGVRWNSVYLMVKRALKLEVVVREYLRTWKRKDKEAYDLQQDVLDEQDWEELRHFAELLKPFYTVTKRVEGNANKPGYEGSHGALWEVLMSIDYLYKKLSTAADEITADKDNKIFTNHYQTGVNTGFLKLKEYFTLTDRSPLYRAAIALHPCHKFAWFEAHWSRNKSYITAAKKVTKELFATYVGEGSAPSVTGTAPAPRVSRKRRRSESSDDEDYSAAFHTASVRPKLSETRDTELERFMADTDDVRGYEERPLAWWRDIGEKRYATLALMAYDLFLIPGMSSECERAFSHGKKMIRDERYRLKADVIEADQCVKSWYRHRVITGESIASQTPPTRAPPVTPPTAASRSPTPAIQEEDQEEDHVMLYSDRGSDSEVEVMEDKEDHEDLELYE